MDDDNMVRSARRLCTGVCLGLLVACTPTHNWREIRPGGAGLVALWPCKPDQAQRTVVLAGREVALHMSSCDVAGQTFAAGAIGLPEGLAASDVVSAWRKASLASLRVAEDRFSPWQPPLRSGLQAQGWRADGVRHDGQAVHAQAVVLTQGGTVFQLVVYGQPAPEVLTTWLDGVRLEVQP
jgi:hypothetical protein